MVKFNEEDTLVWALRIAASGADVDSIIVDARKLQEFLSSPEVSDRPDWSEVSAVPDLVAERDRARETAVRLEQELAESEARFLAAEQEIDKKNDNLVKGVLLEVKRFKSGSPSEEAAVKRAANQAADKFGVTL